MNEIAMIPAETWAKVVALVRAEVECRRWWEAEPGDREGVDVHFRRIDMRDDAMSELLADPVIRRQLEGAT